jgi:mRNA interferase RelE/StbE
VPRYHIEVGRQPRKFLARLAKREQTRIVRAIAGLADEPRPYGVKVLSGEENFYRIRVGDYRIIYEIDGKRIMVLVLRIGHRKDVYRDLIRKRRGG